LGLNLESILNKVIIKSIMEIHELLLKSNLK